jgi:hypothetical protein
MDSQRFRSLSAQDRALVALAVLFDGREAPVYLAYDASNGKGLERAASDLAAQEAEMRMPYLGTLLRRALEEME